MRIAMMYVHHPRNVPTFFYRRALRALGHEVISIGPSEESEPYGCHGRRMPTVGLPYQPHEERTYAWKHVARALPWTPDLVFVISSGDRFAVDGITVPWIHLSIEGDDTEWSEGLTPCRWAIIPRVGQSCRWLPNAYCNMEHAWRAVDAEREYDFVHMATARDARRIVYGGLSDYREIHSFIGDIWGPIYAAAHQHGKTTYVCATFITQRLVEAAAMGCLVFSNPGVPELIGMQAGEHYIPYGPIRVVHNELGPDPDWLAPAIIDLMRNPAERIRIASAAQAHVVDAHSYATRAAMLLGDAITEWRI